MKQWQQLLSSFRFSQGFGAALRRKETIVKMGVCGRTLWLAIGLLLGGAGSSLGRDYCVDPVNGLDSNLGTWASPYKTLSNAVAKATAASDVIKVSQGTITMTANGVAMTCGTALGGYATPSGGVEGPRDPVAYPTIIDGANTYSGPFRQSKLLDGFTVQNCSGFAVQSGAMSVSNCVFSGTTAAQNYAAVRLDSTDNTFYNCVFSKNYNPSGNNRSAGAVFAFGANLTVRFIKCSFIANTNACTGTAEGGGAIYEYKRTSMGGLMQFTDCTFSNNIATTANGGAICTYGRLEFFGSNNVFYGNTAGTSGGAIWNSKQGTGAALASVFSNCTFTANRAANGGAIYLAALSTNVFHSCVFVTNNNAISEGAANGLLRLTSCTFSNNTAGSGAAVYSQGTLDLSGGANVFYGNTSSSGGGAIYHSNVGVNNVFSNCTFTANRSTANNGGAIFFNQYNTNSFVECTFVTNTAGSTTGRGGAIYTLDSGSGGLLQVNGCTFSNNAAIGHYGGAINGYNLQRLVVSNSIFYGNTSSSLGGAVFLGLTGGNHTFVNSTFVANSAGGSFGGGAICFNSPPTNSTFIGCAFITNTATAGPGSAICNRNNGPFPLQLINCTFFANRAAGNGAVNIAGASTTLAVTNCIFWANTGGTTNIVAGGTLKLAYSDIATNASAITGVTLTFGDGIINKDPLFASTTAPYDVHLKSQYGRWTPGGWVNDSQSSPCIDAGDPASDFSLEPKGSRGIELGAYGNTPQASRSKVGGGTVILLW